MPVINQIKHLINLSRIDGDVADEEKEYIYNIGISHDIPTDQIDRLFESDHEIIIPTNLTSDQKFDYVFSLVQLMKIDEKLFKAEIEYCSKIASKLGFDREILFELLLKVKTSAMRHEEIADLRELTDKHLRA